MPGKADAEALQALKGARPEPHVHPSAYAWVAMVSKFSPEKQAAWK